MFKCNIIFGAASLFGGIRARLRKSESSSSVVLKVLSACGIY